MKKLQIAGIRGMTNMKLIDDDALKLGIISQSNDGRESYSTELICEFIDEQPEIVVPDINGEVWFPADQHPEVDENGYSEDVIIKIKWWDNDITKGVGWYSRKNGWNEDHDDVAKVIEWTYLPK